MPLDELRPMTTAAIQWYGGKTIHLPWLLPLLPRAPVFVDAFGGSGAVILNRPYLPLLPKDNPTAVLAAVLGNQDELPRMTPAARIAELFDTHDTPVMTFSGGLDSLALLALARTEARRRGRDLELARVDDELLSTGLLRSLETTAALPGVRLTRASAPPASPPAYVYEALLTRDVGAILPLLGHDDDAPRLWAITRHCQAARRPRTE